MYNKREDLLNEGENKLKEWEVLSNTTMLNLKTICMEIENGKKEVGGINLKPYYQRKYKFTKKDESLLIESLLAGIPIPTIYLASDTTKFPHTSNVIDGQHRLQAVYRFLNNKFALSGLEKYHFLNGLKFSDLNLTIQNKLSYQVSLTLQFIHIQNNPELEIEIFTRYNKGTHPLTSQEIRSVVFNSQFDEWLDKKVDELKEDEFLKESYNISPKRYKDKNVQADFYVMFAILERGINHDFFASTEYSNFLMKEISFLTPDLQKEKIEKYNKFLNVLNKLLVDIFMTKGIQNPFSKEVYLNNLSKRNHKVQVSILMILTPVLQFLTEQEKDFNESECYEIQKAIRDGFIKSGFDKVTSSTTRPELVFETSNKIMEEILSIF